MRKVITARRRDRRARRHCRTARGPRRRACSQFNISRGALTHSNGWTVVLPYQVGDSLSGRVTAYHPNAHHMTGDVEGTVLGNQARFSDRLGQPQRRRLQADDRLESHREGLSLYDYDNPSVTAKVGMTKRALCRRR